MNNTTKPTISSSSSTILSSKPTTTTSSSSSSNTTTTTATRISTPADAEEYVLNYLKRTNRPVSLVLLDQNIHSIIPKTILQQVLDNLYKKEYLAMKDFNKTTLYWLNQNQFQDITPTKLTSMQQQINELQQRATELTMQRKSYENRIQNVQNSLTDEELTKQLQEYEKIIQDKENRLQLLTGNSSSSIIDPKEKIKLRASMERYRKSWSTRKNTVMDLLNSISEGTGKKLSVLCESIGIETDKDAGVDIKDYSV